MNMDEMKKEIKAGHTVRIISEPYILMTVESAALRTARCIWFDKNGILHKDDFTYPTLVLVNQN